MLKDFCSWFFHFSSFLLKNGYLVPKSMNFAVFLIILIFFC